MRREGGEEEEAREREGAHRRQSTDAGVQLKALVLLKKRACRACGTKEGPRFQQKKRTFVLCVTGPAQVRSMLRTGILSHMNLYLCYYIWDFG